MDLQKTKIYLDKLNREFTRLSRDPDNIARIDIDIMASYVRELYDAMLSESSGYAAKNAPIPAHKPAARPHEVIEQPAAAAPQPVIVPPPPVVIAPEPVAPAPAPPPPVVAPVAVVPPPPAPVPAPAPVIAAPVVVEPVAPVVSSGYADILFEERQAKELSEKLSELPIADLKKAIALNDRLLLTRELFSGDGQAFEAAITALNSFTQFGEAQQYLLDQAVVRYGWLDKKRVEPAKNFIKLVRRRYK